MCGVNYESLVSEIVITVVGNEKFFENMTTDEKIKAVPALYKALYHEMVKPEQEHEHNHNHVHEHK